MQLQTMSTSITSIDWIYVRGSIYYIWGTQMNQSRFRRAGIVLATCAALLLGGGGAYAAPQPIAGSVTSQDSDKTSDPKNQAVVRAVDEAFRGDNQRLEALLNGPHSAAVQQELRSRLEARGDFRNSKVPEPAQGSDPTLMATGDYDNYCTGYNGVTMGWYGKEILACHGWLDSYISGRQVAHYSPDLIPRGYPVSVGCAYAAIGVIMSLTMPVGTIGWAAYGSGVLYAGGSIVISCG